MKEGVSIARVPPDQRPGDPLQGNAQGILNSMLSSNMPDMLSALGYNHQHLACTEYGVMQEELTYYDVSVCNVNITYKYMVTPFTFP